MIYDSVFSSEVFSALGRLLNCSDISSDLGCGEVLVIHDTLFRIFLYAFITSLDHFTEIELKKYIKNKQTKVVPTLLQPRAGGGRIVTGSSPDFAEVDNTVGVFSVGVPKRERRADTATVEVSPKNPAAVVGAT